MPTSSAAMKRIIGVIPPCPCLLGGTLHGAGARPLESLHLGGTGIEDLCRPIQHLGVEGHALWIEVGAWRRLRVEVPELVLAPHQRGAVPHARGLADVGGDVADGV